MTIRISLHSDRYATVTLRPSWLAVLLLGRREQTRNVWRFRDVADRQRWAYTDDNRDVSADVADAIDRAMTVKAVGQRMEEAVRR